MYLREFTGGVTCSRRCKPTSPDRIFFFFSIQFICGTTRSYLHDCFYASWIWNVPSYTFLLRVFSLSSSLSLIPFAGPVLTSACRPKSARSPTRRETRDRVRQRNEDRGSLKRRVKTHNVYSSPIEDERSFQGSASVARIWIWKYATN